MDGKIFIFRDLLTTLSMAAFRIVINNKSDRTIWGYLFFVGLAIGLLAKGPVALVMTGLPTFLWTLWQRKWSQVWATTPLGHRLAANDFIECPLVSSRGI
jgi:4-amino-4-deoxy-L-arabinose transferase-like glycosyltransferase